MPDVADGALREPRELVGFVLFGAAIAWNVGCVGPVATALGAELQVSLGTVGVLTGTTFFVGVVVAKLAAAGLIDRIGTGPAARVTCVAAVIGNLIVAASPIAAHSRRRPVAVRCQPGAGPGAGASAVPLGGRPPVGRVLRCFGDLRHGRRARPREPDAGRGDRLADRLRARRGHGGDRARRPARRVAGRDLVGEHPGADPPEGWSTTGASDSSCSSWRRSVSPSSSASGWCRT